MKSTGKIPLSTIIELLFPCQNRNLFARYFNEYFPIFKLKGCCEIDEVHLGAKNKATHGRRPKKPIIVFGIKERDSGLFKLFPVQDKKKETILPIIA